MTSTASGYIGFNDLFRVADTSNKQQNFHLSLGSYHRHAKNFMCSVTGSEEHIDCFAHSVKC